MTPEQYCSKKVIRAGSSLYYSLLYLSEEQRNAAIAIHAFCREARDIVSHCSEPAIARSKLDWWRSETDRCYGGQAQHPVSKALTVPLQNWNLPREYFYEILDAVQMDLDRHHYKTFSELALYSYRVSGVCNLLATEVYGYNNRATLKYTQTLGTALQLTRILNNLPADIQQGRLYIPLETLQQFDIDPNALYQNQQPDKFRPLFEYLTRQAGDYFDQALEQLPVEDRYRQRPGLIMTAIQQALLREIEADGCRLLERHIGIPPLRKFWIAWKTNRREKHHRSSQG